MKRFIVLYLFLINCVLTHAQGTGTVGFVETRVVIEEGATQVRLGVERLTSNLLPANVNYRLLNSNAKINEDFILDPTGTLQWGEGDESVKYIDIDIIDDANEESDEFIVLELVDPSDGVYIGDASTAHIKILGEESGSLGFALEKYITSENDRFTKVMVSRRQGLKGAILIDYEIRELTELSELEHLGFVRHYRRLPDEDSGIQSKVLPGKKAQAGRDFIPESGTLLFLDYQSSATIGVRVLTNPDGDVYPHTVLEMAVSNVRPLTNFDDLRSVSNYSTDIATLAYVEQMTSNPSAFVPENTFLTQTIEEERRLASLRINDITGPGIDVVWEQQVAPDTLPRQGFRFTRARYNVVERPSSNFPNIPAKIVEIPVLRSAPFDQEVSVRYMVGPNRGFAVDDPVDNWDYDEPNDNPLVESFENVNEKDPALSEPQAETGDQLFFGEGGGTYDADYAKEAGDEPRIKPNAFYGGESRMLFGDNLNQLMHNQDLDIPILNPGSDVPFPTGPTREAGPSFNKPISTKDVKRDFFVRTGTLTWGAEDFEPKFIEIEVIDDEVLEFNEDMVVVLYEPDYEREEIGRDTQGEDQGGDNPDDPDDPDDPNDPSENEITSLKPGASLGVQYWATVTILSEAGGKVSGSADSTFDAKINNDVYDMALIRKGLDISVDNADSKKETMLLVGDFTSINSTPLNRIGKVYTSNGQVDNSFNPGTGADSFINSVKEVLFTGEDANGNQIIIPRFYIGGGFSSYNGQPRSGIARILWDGTIDNDFIPGSGIEDGTVHDIDVQGRRVLVVGEFGSVKGIKRNSIVRLLENGDVDLEFNPGLGPNGPVFCVRDLPDGRILIGGSFTKFGEVDCNSIAVLKTNGELDDSFVIGDGVDGEVYDVDWMNRGNQIKIVIGGSFSEVKGYAMNNLAVLNIDGGIDEAFNIGKGTDGPVYTLKVDDQLNVVARNSYHVAEQDELIKEIVGNNTLGETIAGDIDYFSSYLNNYDQYGGYVPQYLQQYLRELLPESYRILIAGDFRSYNETRRMGLARLNPNGSIDTTFMDSAFNQFAGLTTATTTDASGFINSIAVGNDQQAPSVFIGGTFNRIGGGSRLGTVSVTNVAKLGSGETMGPGEIEFEMLEYNVDEDSVNGEIEIRRKNGRRGFATAIIETESIETGAGVAQGSEEPIPGTDYKSLQEKVLFDHFVNSEHAQSLDYYSPIYWFNPYDSIFSFDTDFVDATYYLYDSATYLALLPHSLEPFPGSNLYDKVPRKYLYDSDGVIISEYSPEDELTPAYGFDGLGWQLQDGEDGIKKFNIETVADTLVEGNETAKLKLSVPRGYIYLGGEYIPTGIALGRNEAKVIIIDNDFHNGELKFKKEGDIYANESERSITVDIERINGLNGSISVQYRTLPGTASVPFDYKTKTGTLRFGSGQSNRSVSINLVDDVAQEEDEYFDIELFNVTGGGQIFGGQSSTTIRVYVIDNDLKGGKVEFVKESSTIDEGISELRIPVRRVGGARGQGAVSYYTKSITATAGEDFTSVEGTLTWAHQEVDEKYIVIPIIEDEIIEKEAETFEIILSNPSGVILAQRRVYSVEIIDNDDPGQVSLSDSNYYINENGDKLKVYVKRTEGTKGNIKIDYEINDGTALSDGEFSDYISQKGTLYMADGQAGNYITVKILNDFALENTEYFNLSINSTTEGVEIIEPSVAKISIIDDETVNIPAGSIDTLFDTGVGIKVNGPIEVIKRDDDDNLIISGDFTLINGVKRNGLARLTSSGYLEEDFNINEGPNGLIRDIYPLNDKSMIVVGDFTEIKGIARNRIALINADGFVNTAFDPGSGFDASVQSIIELKNGNFLILGEFTYYKNKIRKGHVIINSIGQDVTPWPSSVGSVGVIMSAVELDDGSIILAGNFEQFSNNSKAQKIVKLRPNGEVDELFVENFSSAIVGNSFKNGKINKLLLHPDGDIIAVGSFELSILEGRKYSNIVKINTSGEFSQGASEVDRLAALNYENEVELQQNKYDEIYLKLEESISVINEKQENYINDKKALNESQQRLFEINGEISELEIKLEDPNSTNEDLVEYNAAKTEKENIENTIIIIELDLKISEEEYLAARNVNESNSNLAALELEILENLKVELAIAENKANRDDYKVYSGVGIDKFVNNEILDAALQPDGKLVIVGGFTKINGKNRNRVARLLPNGNLDPTINFELGADNKIRTIEIQQNYRILLGGDFQTFNEVVSPYLTKLYGGINHGGGLVSFVSPQIKVPENENGKIITLKRQLGLTTDAKLSLKIESTDANKWFPGLEPEKVYDYVGFSTLDSLGWPPEPKDALIINFGIGEVFKEIKIISINSVDEIDNIDTLRRSSDMSDYILYIVDDKLADEPDETLTLTLTDFEEIGAGPQSTSDLIIENNDSAIAFSNLDESGLRFNYNIDESNQEKIGKFHLLRTGATNRIVSVSYKTEEGTAKAYGLSKDYDNVMGEVTFGIGEIEKVISIPIYDDFQHEGIESIIIKISDSQPKGSALILGPSEVEIIIDDSDKDLSRTQIYYEYGNYNPEEVDGELLLKVIREGDLSDSSSVKYRTIDENASGEGLNRDFEKSEGELTFKPGEKEKTISIKIFDDYSQESNEIFYVELYESIGAQLKKQIKASVQIQDREAGTIMFTNWNDPPSINPGILPRLRNNTYYVTETEGSNLNQWYAGNSLTVNDNDQEGGVVKGDDPGIRVNITRMDGVHGRIKMDFTTVDGEAKAGEHYISQSGTLTMEEGQNHAHIVVPILPFGNWTEYIQTEFGLYPITIDDADFKINISNLRKDDGEPDYIKPQFKNENWQPSGQISATVIVQRSSFIHPYVDEFGETALGTDGPHFARTNHRVRESQEYARVRVYKGGGLNLAVEGVLQWAAIPETPLGGVNGQNWSAFGWTRPPEPVREGDTYLTEAYPLIGPDSPFAISVFNSYAKNGFNGNELFAGSDYAYPGYPNPAINPFRPESAIVYPFADGDYAPIGGQIAFGENDLYKDLYIPIFNDDEIEFNEDFFVFLWAALPGHLIPGRWEGEIPVTRVTIVSDGDLKIKETIVEDNGERNIRFVSGNEIGESAAGSYDRNFNPHSQYDTIPPYNFDPGANNQVHAIAKQRNGKIIIGGDFTSFNSFPVNRLSRLYIDGSLDRTFKIGTGADDTVTNIEVRDSEDGEKILISGGFKSYNGIVSYGMVELNSDGSINQQFDVGTGFDSVVRDFEIQDDGGIIVGGQFINYNNQASNYLIKLNADGSVNEKFSPRYFPDAPVNAVATAPDGSVIIVGEFTKLGDLQRRYIAKYKSDGRLDPDFDSVEGADGVIHDVVVQPDGKIIIGGDFNNINFVKRNKIARLNTNGTVDRSFEPGLGFDSTVFSLLLDKNKLRSVPNLDNPDSTSVIDNPEYLNVYAGGLFHEYDGVRRVGLARINGDGSIDTTFMDSSFNQFAGIPRRAAKDQRNFIRDIEFVGPSKDIYISGSFDLVGGGYDNFSYSPQNNITRIIGNRYGHYLTLYQNLPPVFVESGVTRGPGKIGFASDHYFADEFIESHFIKLKREGGNLGKASVMAGTINSSELAGRSTENQDYQKNIKEIIYPSLWAVFNRSALYKGGWQYSDAFEGFNNSGHFQDDLGYTIFNPDSGLPEFLSVIRGDQYFTDLNELYIKVNNDDLIEGNERVELTLWQPKSKLFLGGANMGAGFSLGKRKAFLTTVDDDFKHGVIRFVRSEYYTNEGVRRVQIDLERVDGANGQISVRLVGRDLNQEELSDSKYDKAIGLSIDSDYSPLDLDVTFEPEENYKSVYVEINNDTVKENDESFKLELLEPKGGARLDGPFGRSESVVVIIDDDYEAGVITLSEKEYHAQEDDNYLDIGVKRLGGTQGQLLINYRIERITEDITDEFDLQEGEVYWATKDSEDKFIRFTMPNDNFVHIDQQYRITLFNIEGTESKQPRYGVSQAIINIQEDDRYGELSFASSDFYVSENGGEFTVSVQRLNGFDESISVDYLVSNGSAISGEDFIETSGTLNFEAGQPSASFNVTILNGDEAVNENETIVLKITNPKPSLNFYRRAVLGTPNIAVLNIIDDEKNNVPPGVVDTSFNQSASTDDFVDTIEIQNDGKFIIGGEFTNVNGLNRSRIARLKSNGQIDSAYNLGGGFDGPVRSIKVDEDGKAIVAGYFKSFDGVVRNGLARLNEDGVLDDSFNPGGGPDNPVNDISIQKDGSIIIVGDFTSYNGQNRMRIARILPNGNLDSTFDPGIGPDSSINTVDIRADGKIVIGGDFTKFNLKNQSGIAVLNSDGSLSEIFKTGLGLNGSVKKVVVQPDLKVLVGGLFTEYQGIRVNRIMRLETNGNLDKNFKVENGANAAVYSIALQQDGKILIGGDFNKFNNLNKNAIVRLNRDGSPDPTINFGTGANGSILAIGIRDDYKIILGGGFTEFNSTPKSHIVQIHGGLINSPGKLQFNFPSYIVNEKGTNAVIKVVRTGGLIGNISTLLSTRDIIGEGNATPNLDYYPILEELDFPEGEAIRDISVDIINDVEIESDEKISLLLSNFTAGTEGLQKDTEIIIRSDDSSIGFGSPLYSVTEGQDGAQARIMIERLGSLIGNLEMTFLTATNGTAQAGSDFLMVSNKIEFKNYETAKYVNIPVLDDNKIEPLESVVLLLTNIVGNAYISDDEAKLNIIDNDFATGEFSFEYPSYKTMEGNDYATLSIVRTNGFTGIVEVDYEVSDLTAILGRDYGAERGSVIFADGEFVQFIDIPVLDDKEEEGAEAFKVRITKATGDAKISVPNFANVIILDDESEDFIKSISGIGADGPVYSINADRNGYLVAGGFNEINGVTTGALAYFDKSGVVNSIFGDGVNVNNAVNVAKFIPNGYLIGGLFNSINGNSVNRLIKLHGDGSLDSNFHSPIGISSTVYDIEVINNSYYIGGSFGLAKISTDGALIDDFGDLNLQGSIYDIEINHDGIYIGGKFTLGNDNVHNLCRLTHSGDLDRQFNISESPDAAVNTIASDNNIIYVGGAFVTIGGSSQRRISSLKPDGNFNKNFTVGTGFDDVVRKIKFRKDGRILISGAFNNWRGKQASKIVLIDEFGDCVSDNFNRLNLSNTVYDIDEIAGKTFAFGGSFEGGDESPYSGVGVVEGFTSSLPPELLFRVKGLSSSIEIVGEADSRHDIEFSIDLINWSKLSSESTDSNGKIIFEVDLNRFDSQYFRAVKNE